MNFEEGLSEKLRKRFEEYADEEKQILNAWFEFGDSKYSWGRGLVDMAQDEETGRRTFKALMDAVLAIHNQAYARGMAQGLIMAGRHDIIARIPDVEKAAAVLMAEQLNRKDNNDA
jgi:hypothetical protein